MLDWDKMDAKTAKTMQRFIDENEVFEDFLRKDPYFIKPLPNFLPILLAWLFIFIFPLLRMFLFDRVDFLGLAYIYIPLLLTTLVFFVNQRFFIPRFFFRRKFKTYFFANVFLFIGSLFLYEFLIFFVNPAQSFFLLIFTEVNTGYSGFHLFKFIFFFFIIVLISNLINISFSIIVRWTRRGVSIRYREKEHFREKLSFLTKQLSPHFLFNTLNNIMVLIDIDSKRASQSLFKLSSLLRLMLYETEENFVLLSKELKLVRLYSELEQLRLAENFNFKIKSSIENDRAKIAPLTLIPLVENVMKHGCDPVKKSFAFISIIEKDNRLIYTSENSNFPKKQKKENSGLGLSTFKARLKLTYQGCYTYRTTLVDDVYKVYLEIDLGVPPKERHLKIKCLR